MAARVALLLLLSTSCVVLDAKRTLSTLQDLLRLTQQPGGRPPHVSDVAFDCAWRLYAIMYAQQIQPWIGATQLQAINDSLQLNTACASISMSSILPPSLLQLPSATSSPRSRPQPAAHITADCTALACFYVDPLNGSDGNDGTITAPLRTIATALNRTRGSAHAAVVLRNGTFFLNETLQLTPADSGVLITAYPGEAPVISGGVPLQIGTWAPFNVSANGSWGPVLVNENAVYGQCGNPTVPNKGVTPSWQACQASCQASAACTAWTWNGPGIGQPFTNVCCWRTDEVFSLVAENSTWSQAFYAPKNVWVAPVSAYSTTVPTMPALQVRGARATLARFPNANPELDLFPAGYITYGGTWLPPAYTDPPFTYTVALPSSVQDPAAGIYINYTVGIGGAAARYDPPRSFWASADFGPQAWMPTHVDDRWQEMHLRSPSGLDFGTSLPNAPYAPGAATGAIVHTWRPGHWYSWFFELGPQLSDTAYNFSAGGFQGGEGSDTAAEWWIEGVFAELDARNEYYYNASTGMLYFFFNSSSTSVGGSSSVAPPADGFVVPTLPVLLNIFGSADTPVVNITLSGITFTAAAPTFMAPHGVPSGGDWALERLGAVLAEGTHGLSVSGCTFTRNDGNGIFLSGYNRNASITRNVFEWLGGSAIAAWGRADDYDGTGGDQPRFTVVEGNLAYELGIQQKQSSFYFQAVSCQNTIASNIVYNIPRAAINFDDSFGGGTIMSENLLYNTCRESSDHGAFNSWHRMPYVTLVRDGVTPSAIPAPNVGARNFIVANYAADGGCYDTDDGSSFYIFSNNFCVYGGHKSDFDGHSKRSEGNLHVYPSVYGPTCIDIVAQLLPLAGYEEVYVNNTCILSAAGQDVLQLNGLQIPPPAAFTIALGNNTIFAPNASAMVQYSETVTFQSFAAAGYDSGSVVSGSMPDAATIIAWAAQLLASTPSG